MYAIVGGLVCYETLPFTKRWTSPPRILSTILVRLLLQINIVLGILLCWQYVRIPLLCLSSSSSSIIFIIAVIVILCQKSCWACIQDAIIASLKKKKLFQLGFIAIFAFLFFRTQGNLHEHSVAPLGIFTARLYEPWHLQSETMSSTTPLMINKQWARRECVTDFFFLKEDKEEVESVAAALFIQSPPICIQCA